MTNSYLALRTPPAGVPDRPLSDRQHDPDETDLQRAAAAVHRRTQRISTTQELGAVVLAASGVLSALLERFQGPVAITGFVWFVVSAFVLNGFAQRAAERAATIQEVFDCRLFYLDWNDTLDSADGVVRSEILRLARKVAVGSEPYARVDRGWYDPTDGVAYPYDVLCAQEQNLRWDIRLRTRFKIVLALLGSGWAVLGFAVALAGTSLAETLLVVFVPAAAAYDLGRERWRVQNSVSNERQRLARIVTQVLDQAEPGHVPGDDERTKLSMLARRVQDGIFRSRSQFGRVPELLYKAFRTQDEDDFAKVAEDRRRTLAGES